MAAKTKTMSGIKVGPVAFVLAMMDINLTGVFPEKADLGSGQLILIQTDDKR